MAETGAMFLSDQLLKNGIFTLVRQSAQYLKLITPYFDPPQRLLREILAARRRNVTVTLVLRRDAILCPPARDAVDQLRGQGVVVSLVDWLHAKIYISENEAVVTSLNLVDSSFNESREAGCRFYSSSVPFLEALSYANSLERESVPYEAAAPAAAAGRASSSGGTSGGAAGGGGGGGSDAHSTRSDSSFQPSPQKQRTESTAATWKCQACTLENPLRNAECVACRSSRNLPLFGPAAAAAAPHGYPLPAAPPPAPPPARAAAAAAAGNSSSGYCIHCRDACPRLRAIRPFCRTCYRSPDECSRGYHCHVCGDSAATALDKPLCKRCWRAHKDEFDFLE